MIPGICHTLFRKEYLKISIVYIDCNDYNTAINSLEVLYPFFSKGCILAVDENTLGGETKALEEFCNKNNLDFVNIPDQFIDVAGDVGIHFCLAEFDPDGNPSTGITRTQTDEVSFSMSDDKMKMTIEGGIDPWDTERYLNIWVCNLNGSLLDIDS